MNPSNNSTQKRLFQTLALALGFANIVAVRAAPPDYPPARFPAAGGWGKNIQRTMRLLATSTAGKRNTVRILFYGQSITEHRPIRPLHRCEKVLSQPLGRHISTLRRHYFP